MKIISKTPGPGRAYPPLLPWPGPTAPEGCLIWPESLPEDTFRAYSGFVILTTARGVVTGCEPNLEAYHAWQAAQLPALAEAKKAQVNAACQALIYSGLDVELSGGVQHFALTPNDQTNIDSMFSAVTLGATQYPYHADGAVCVMYPAADIMALYVAYKSFVTQQTTYCNFLRAWIDRETDPDTLAAIAYGSPLPEDLAAQMQQILQAAQAEIQAVAAKLQSTEGLSL